MYESFTILDPWLHFGCLDENERACKPTYYKRTSCNLSQKSLATLRRKPSPASPLSMLLQWCRLFFRYFFEPAKQHWAGGMGEKEATVWKSYVKYVVSFYVMWISTLLQSHVRARPDQRWRCTILNKIITAATAVELHGNWCSLNHVDMNL